MRIDQSHITEFGVLTDDIEPMHTDAEWCAKHSPVGTPIAYGFLTLSLLTALLRQASAGALVATRGGSSYPLNYGFDRVRFVSPVPVGARIRGHFTMQDRRPRRDGELLRIAVVVEIEGTERPALTAEWLSLWVYGSNDDSRAPST